MTEETTGPTPPEGELHTESHDPAVPEAYSKFMRTGWGERELDLPPHAITTYAAARRARLAEATPDERLVLAGDGIRCDYPVALMERAATTGFLAANRLLTRWDLAGHDLWTVPTSSRNPGLVKAHWLLSPSDG